MVIIVMGVSGSGKSTIGQLLARKLGWRFTDADDFHPPQNVEKMRNGMALSDDDRKPWLNALAALIRECYEKNESVVLACSALRAGYRERLAQDLPDVRFVHLHGPVEVIRTRLAGRKGHYMNPALLDSQFATLERPEGAIELDIRIPPKKLVAQIIAALGIS